MNDRQVRTNEAVRRFSGALTESYGAATGRAIASWRSHNDLARSFFDGTIGNLKTQAEKNLDVSWDLVEQARTGREAGAVLVRESANAYADFLDSIFLCYRENVRMTENRASDEPNSERRN